MMASQPNDPTQFLANLFQTGQEMMQQFTSPNIASEAGDSTVDPAAAFVAASKHYVETQQTYVKQMTNLWSGIFASPSAPAPVGETEKDDDKRFKSEAW